MGFIDLGILAFLAIFAYSGYRTGIIQKVFSIAGVILALILAAKFMDVGARVLVFITGIKGGGLRGPLPHILSFLMIFEIVIATTKISYYLLTTASKRLSRVQRGLGSVAGFFEGVILLSVFLVWLNVVSFPTEYQKERSVLYKPVLHFAPRLFDEIVLIFPKSEGFHDELSKHFNLDQLLKR
ncbi:MAG: CvpA family protein [Bacteroidota bacterium]